MGPRPPSPLPQRALQGTKTPKVHALSPQSRVHRRHRHLQLHGLPRNAPRIRHRPLHHHKARKNLDHTLPVSSPTHHHQTAARRSQDRPHRHQLLHHLKRAKPRRHQKTKRPLHGLLDQNPHANSGIIRSLDRLPRPKQMG